MKRFYAMCNRDAADAYVNALAQAGYQQCKHLNDADFLLYDYERGSGGKRYEMEKFLKNHPGFIYPHTPASCFLWDGPYDPLPVCCNFVAGPGQMLSMTLYGYPNRVEYCGFPRCEVKDFTPANDALNLLFVPARTRRDGGYANKEYQESTPRVFKFLFELRKHFASITMCYTNTFETVGIADLVEDAKAWGVRFVKTDPYTDPNPAGAMLKRIEQADVVVACETVGYLAVARGKPTIFYNARSVPGTLRGYAKNYREYRCLYEFPLTIEEMVMADIFETARKPNLSVEQWKHRNIHGNFNAKKFISVVEEYV